MKPIQRTSIDISSVVEADKEPVISEFAIWHQ